MPALRRPFILASRLANRFLRGTGGGEFISYKNTIQKIIEIIDETLYDKRKRIHTNWLVNGWCVRKE